MCSARALRRCNDVSSFAGSGLNCPRLVLQAHRFPCFSKALPPQKLALPLFPKPGFVTISFRHNSLLCERITSIIPGPTVSGRSVDHLPTSRLRMAARLFILIPLPRPACQFRTAHPCGQKCSSQSIQRIRRPLMSSYAHPSLYGVDNYKDHTLPATVSSAPFLVALEAHRRLDGPPYSRRGLSAMRRSSPPGPRHRPQLRRRRAGDKLTCGFERSPCERIPSERQPTR
jgi:hypothetical protein